MYLPPLRSIEHYEPSINGEVKIDPNAVLAPGVIITAAPGSQVIVGADVTIGMGVVINAAGGTIEIETGAAVGAGVLIVGQAKIGRGAAVGMATTIFNASIPASTVVAAGSTVGDRSRQVSVEAVEVEISASTQSSTKVTSKVQTKQQSTSAPSKSVTSSTNNGFNQASDAANSEIENKSSENSDKNAPIGKVYVNQLLLSLFPHRKAQINPDQDDR